VEHFLSTKPGDVSFDDSHANIVAITFGWPKHGTVQGKQRCPQILKLKREQGMTLSASEESRQILFC
jgi:hypothetical protein